MRRKLLEDVYGRLSQEDKVLFAKMTMEDKGHREIMEALNRQKSELEEIRKGQSWFSDFGANIAGNAVWDGLLWLFRKL